MSTTALNSKVVSIVCLSFVLTGCMPAEKGSTKYREELYEGCASCHGENGEGNAAALAPAIAGLSPWFLKSQLRKYQSSVRGWHADDVGGLKMQPMSEQLTNNEDLAWVAEYIATMPTAKGEPTLEGGDATRGKIYWGTCAACHGQDGSGDLVQQAPPLTQQSDWYLASQLKNFKAGIRGTHKDDVTGALMRPMSMTLPDEQAIKDVVAYIQTAAFNLSRSK